MTKEQEIESLKEYIDSLPEDTYLKPALTESLPWIAREIMSDFAPALPGVLEEWRKQLDGLRKESGELQHSNGELRMEINQQEKRLKVLNDGIDTANELLNGPARRLLYRS